MSTKLLALLVLLTALAGSVWADQEMNDHDVDEIIARANHAALYQGDDSKAAVRMEIVDARGRVRLRAFRTLRKNDDADDRDQRYYVLFESPADVRKMVFVVHKKAAPDQDDDRWLYLPGLDLVRRIAASDKRTSFAGSDFLYEDISGRSPEDDSHELIETAPSYWVIKNVPRQPEDVEFAYYIARIDRSSFVPLKLEYFKADGRRYREIESVRIEAVTTQVNGEEVEYQTVRESVARDLETGSVTRMIVSEIEYNLGLDDSLFTERYLRRPPRHVLR